MSSSWVTVVPLTWPTLSQSTIRNSYMNLMTSRKHCLVTAEIRSSARYTVDAVKNALSTKPAWTVAAKPCITLVCTSPNSKHATTIKRSCSDTGRRARRLNFRNTSGHARTLVRILSSHGKSSVRPNHTTMEVDNAIFVSQKNITSWPQTEVLPLIKELSWLTSAVTKTKM